MRAMELRPIFVTTFNNLSKILTRKVVVNCQNIFQNELQNLSSELFLERDHIDRICQILADRTLGR